MSLILYQVLVQTVSTTLHWIGFCVGLRASMPPGRRRLAWIVGAGAVSAAWLYGVMLIASNDFFRIGVLPPRIPLAIAATLAFGCLLLLSQAFRRAIGAIPQHWLIGIQTFRILGGVFLIRYYQGELPGLFAIPAGVGDLMTGVLAPFVAYWWFSGRTYARGAAIAWNVFGMLDLINAVALGALTGASGLVFPIVMTPVYAVPRAFLIHAYSLIGLISKTSQMPAPQERL